MKVESNVVSRIARDILEGRDATSETAARVADSLVLAERRRVPTHGLGLMPLYCDLISAGVIDTRASPVSEKLSDCLARVDGRGAFGQLTGAFAIDLGLQLVAAQGIAAVGVVDGTHLGRLGEWAELACDAGAVFLAFTNTAGGALNVAGVDGSERVLSTNPVAIGIPTFDALDHPVVVDFASSQTSGSRIREAANAGARLDPDWTVTASGEETDDPQAFLTGLAALRPLGGRSAGHKGFGLMVAAEMLAALAGGLMAGEDAPAWFSNGALFCFIDVRRFGDERTWGERSRVFRDYLSSRGCRMPGSRPLGASAELDLADHTVAALLALAREAGVNTRGVDSVDVSVGLTRTW